MYSDPQSLTINSVANSLPRVSTNGAASVYQKDDGNVKLTISHLASAKRNRRLARVDFRKVAADAMFPAQNVPYTMACHVVVDVPNVGFSITEQQQVVQALQAWLTSANIAKLLGGES